jgi:hypothetical protein
MSLPAGRAWLTFPIDCLVSVSAFSRNVLVVIKIEILLSKSNRLHDPLSCSHVYHDAIAE